MTDPLVALAWSCLGCAAVPAAAFVWNLRHYKPPETSGRGDEWARESLPEPALESEARLPLTHSPPLPLSISVLIPARNEEHSIGPCVESVLVSRGVEVEVVVLDDRSDDGTAGVVRAIAGRDPRVRLETAPALPAGWCGKQHACWTLARHATHDRLVFLDADVRLSPDALARTTSHADATGADLLSGFPTEETGGFAEKLLIPLIHFVLLGFLLVDQSRRRRGAAWAAGCGQFFLTTRSAYLAAGGHAAIRRSLHDGVTLPRAYRRAGRTTDLVDLTGLARCRMYRTAGEVWNGLSKNATEGLAAPGLIVPVTALLTLGQVLPPVLTAAGLLGAFPPNVTTLFGAATLLGYLPRLLAVRRFRQSRLGAALHPVGVAALLAIQWAAFVRKLLGRPATWKGRPYAPSRPVGRVGTGGRGDWVSPRCPAARRAAGPHV